MGRVCDIVSCPCCATRKKDYCREHAADLRLALQSASGCRCPKEERPWERRTDACVRAQGTGEEGGLQHLSKPRGESCTHPAILGRGPRSNSESHGKKANKRTTVKESRPQSVAPVFQILHCLAKTCWLASSTAVASISSKGHVPQRLHNYLHILGISRKPGRSQSWRGEAM